MNETTNPKHTSMKTQRDYDAMRAKYGPGITETVWCCFEPLKVLEMLDAMLKRNNHRLLAIKGGLDIDTGYLEFKVYTTEIIDNYTQNVL